MVRHIALMRWKPEATAEQRAGTIAEMKRMPEHVPELRSFMVEENAGTADGNFDLAIIAELDDFDAYAIYRDHPEHQALIRDMVVPILGERAAVQVQT